MSWGEDRSTGHFVSVCKHGTVVAQCRCPSPNKAKRIVMCPGPPRCTATEVEAQMTLVDRVQHVLDAGHDMERLLIRTKEMHAVAGIIGPTLDEVNEAVTTWNARVAEMREMLHLP